MDLNLNDVTQYLTVLAAVLVAVVNTHRAFVDIKMAKIKRRVGLRSSVPVLGASRRQGHHDVLQSVPGVQRLLVRQGVLVAPQR